MERRIAAILAGDMVGFSRLIELDETGTLVRQRTHLLELIEPTIERLHGHIVKLTGDGIIAEFGSVVEAVQCAVAIQKAMLVREEDQPEDRRIQYRIAVNLGDVVFEDGDVFGDGVNIAARLEALAEPGGVVVSGTAYDLLKTNVDVGYRPLGEKQLKNIATPVRVYQVTEDPASLPMHPRKQFRTRSFVGAALAVLALIIAGWWWQQPDFEPVDPAKLAFVIPDKPSVAIATFSNLTGNAEQGWLAEGLAQSIVSALVASPDMVVISSNAAASMTGQSPAQIAERFGVRYVLQGSIQGGVNTLRISAYLVDSVDGRTLWAENWDRDRGDVLALQDDISKQIMEELQVKLTLGEQARNWRASLETEENMRDMVQGRAAFQQFDPQGHAKAARLWQQIYERIPDNPTANMLMGYLYWQKVLLGISTDISSDWKTAIEYADKSIELGGDGHSHTLRGSLYQLSYQFDEAVKSVETALAITPGDADVLLIGGGILTRSGKVEQGVDLLRKGMRLEPDYPDWVPDDLGEGLTQLGRFNEARAVFESVLASDTKDVWAKPKAHVLLAAISVWESNMPEARDHVSKLIKIFPSASAEVSSAARATLRDRDYVDRLISALIDAGLPEFEPVAPSQMELSLPDQPSVAVLPFENLTGNADNQYLADGFVSSLITELTGLQDLFVIARNSSFALKDQKTSLRKMALKLGVRYIVEGDFQRNGQQLRINVGLVDAIEGRQIWSKIYDRPETEFYILQDELIGDLVMELGGRSGGGIFKAERRRFESMGPDQLEAIQLWEKATQAFIKLTIEGNEENRVLALALIEKAPEHPRGYAALGWHHIGNIWHGTSVDPDVDYAKCTELANKAIQLNTQDYMGHYLLAYCYAGSGKQQASAASMRRAYDLNPNEVLLKKDYANIVLTSEGRHAEAIEMLEQVLRLSPEQQLGIHFNIGSSYLVLGDYSKAIEHIEQERIQSIRVRGRLAAALVLAGQGDRAKVAVQEILKINPDYNVDAFIAGAGWFSEPLKGQLAAALTSAGLPKRKPSEPPVDGISD